MPDEPEVHALLALMRLHHARRRARFADGELVLLADQDRIAVGCRGDRRRPRRSASARSRCTDAAHTFCRRRSPRCTAEAPIDWPRDRRALRRARPADRLAGGGAQPRGGGRRVRLGRRRALAIVDALASGRATAICIRPAPSCSAGSGARRRRRRLSPRAGTDAREPEARFLRAAPRCARAPCAQGRPSAAAPRRPAGSRVSPAAAAPTAPSSRPRSVPREMAAEPNRSRSSSSARSSPAGRSNGSASWTAPAVAQVRQRDADAGSARAARSGALDAASSPRATRSSVAVRSVASASVCERVARE